MGRPALVLPDNFKEVVNKFNSKEINYTKAAKLVPMSRASFLKYAKNCPVVGNIEPTKQI